MGNIRVTDMASIVKHPSAYLDYEIDWTLWLDGDTLATCEWDVPAGITKETSVYNTNVATIWLSGGTDMVNYTLLNRITTTLGRIECKEIIIKVRTLGGS